jgi:3-oxoacyl-[acyl-carrier-protein] synthase-3
MVRRILEDTGADPDRGVYSHHVYGNTASASVGVTYHHMLEERALKTGEKVILGSAAAGFSVVAMMGTWVGPAEDG